MRARWNVGKIKRSPWLLARENSAQFTKQFSTAQQESLLRSSPLVRTPPTEPFPSSYDVITRGARVNSADLIIAKRCDLQFLLFKHFSHRQGTSERDRAGDEGEREDRLPPTDIFLMFSRIVSPFSFSFLSFSCPPPPSLSVPVSGSFLGFVLYTLSLSS